MDENKIEGFEEEAIEILADDGNASDKKLLGPEIYEIAKEEKFYSHIINYLTGLTLREPESKRLWGKVLTHKYLMSEKLGRNIGIRVAALDYFLNIDPRLERVTFVDINEMKKISVSAAYDSLTRVYRKDVMFEKSAELLLAALEKNLPFSVIFFDVDRFKRYNDLLGHLAGDAALYEIAKSMRKFTHNIFRFGGDEFVVFEALTKKDAFGLAGRIVKDIEKKKFSLKNFKEGIAISYGVSSVPEDGGDIKALLAAADKKLLEIKKERSGSRG
ncbi:MAG: diguanylate cyclase [bacterium]